jgi:creatinase
MPIFSKQEMDRRHRAAREAMAAAGVDCVVATSYAASYYLSGAPIHSFGRPMATVVPAAGEPAIVESIIERPHTEHQSWMHDIRTYWDYNLQPVYDDPRAPWTSMVGLLRELLVERGLGSGRIGIEEMHLPWGRYNALREALPEATFVGVSDLLDRLRLILSDEELALVRSADAIADLGQQMLLDLARPGRSARELTDQIRAAMIDAILARHPDKPFNVHVGVGLGEREKGAGHAEWTTWGPDAHIRSGQLLETGMSVWLWGYWGNVERAIFVGEPSAEERRAFETMVATNEAAIAATKPGVRLAEIDRMTKESFGRGGYGTRSGSGCGRGIVSYEGKPKVINTRQTCYTEGEGGLIHDHPLRLRPVHPAPGGARAA